MRHAVESVRYSAHGNNVNFRRLGGSWPNASDATHKASSGAPKRDRTRTLTKVDRRSVLGKRVVELVRVFTEASDGPWTALRKLKVRTAAENVAVAELARGRLMRGEGGELSDVITAERRAAAACRAIGISTF
jgi:hypothetical protein